MSFPKRNVGNPNLNGKIRKWSVKFNFSIFIMLIIILSCSPNSIAVDAEVYATLDVHKIDYLLNHTTPNHIVIPGNITCTIEGLGNNIQQVDIDLWVHCQKYDGSVGPTLMTFTESGRKPFNLTITIPVTARNNSKDTYIITGHWNTQASGYVIGDEGDVTSDSVNITVIREGFIRAPQETTPEYEEVDTWWEELGRETRMGIGFSVFIVIVLTIVFLYYRRRKRKRRLLLEYNDLY
jgi:hypothetical protein